MDAQHFDTFVKLLTSSRPRRTLVRLLLSLPLFGGLDTLLGESEVVAHGRRKRRKKRHKHRPGDNKHNRKRKQRKRCTKAGQLPRPKRPCCAGLIRDANGRCTQGPACTPACAAGQTCQGGVCGVVCGGGFCPAASEICVSGVCQPYTVTCPGGTCDGAALQAALNGGGTVYAGPGRYTGNFDLTQSVNLVGAGDGVDPGTNTILDAVGNGRVVLINTVAIAVVLQNVRITGGKEPGGGGIFNDGTLTLTACTVTGNDGDPLGIGGSGGGIHNANPGQLTLIDCAVTNNAAHSGGGISHNSMQQTTLQNTAVQGNQARAGVGGGIDINTGSVAITANSRVSGNSAATAGGGIFTNAIVTCSAGSSVSGNTVAGNPNNCVETGLGSGCGTCPP